MSKKKHKHKHRPKYRNSSSAPPPRPPAPPRPRAPRKPEENEQTQRLAYTAVGAAGTALVGGFLARQNWEPKVIAGVLAAAGGTMAWAGKSEKLQAIGAGTLAASGGQLALLMLDDRYERAVKEAQRKLQEEQQKKLGADKRQLALPPGSLESAFERARSHLAITSDDYADYQIS